MADEETQVIDPTNLDAEARLLWAQDRFVEMGFQREVAELMAREKVDWHEAQRYIDEGCDLGLVLRILL